MIKRRAAAIGLDRSFAGHSLRSGFATEGYAKKAHPNSPSCVHGRWKLASVMRGYLKLFVTLGVTRQGRPASGQDFLQSLLVRADHWANQPCGSDNCPCRGGCDAAS
jgi:hypothetical protein